MAARASDQNLTNFDIFVLALSVLSIVNMALAIAPLSAAVHNIVLIVDRGSVSASSASGVEEGDSGSRGRCHH